MTPGGRKWLTGCAIGCAVLTVVVGVLAVIAAGLAGRSLEGFIEAGHTRKELMAGHGAPEEFTPPGLDGLPGDRLDLFLSLREDLADDRRRLAEAFLAFPPPGLRESDSALGKAWSVMKGLGGMLRPMGEYQEARNEALLAAGMGEGEYLFYYGLLFYSFLGERPDTLPRLAPDAGEVRLFDDDHASFSAAKARRRYRFYTLVQLRNLAAALGAAAPAALTDEIRRLDGNPGAVAFENGLPPDWAAALEPRRARIEAAWSAASNILEWPRRPGEEGGEGLRLDID